MAMGSFNLPFKIAMQTQTMFQDANCQEIMNLVSLSKEWEDNSLTFRF